MGSEPLVLCVALNCGVDKVYDCHGFGLKGIHQPQRTVTCIGGKAVNQARMLKTLGVRVLVTGFAGGAMGLATRRQLDAEGIPHSFQETQDESRLAITIVDSRSDTHTEVNEWGPYVSPRELEGWLELYDSLLDQARLASFAGSAPAGVPHDIYRRTIGMARRKKVDSMLDARGDWLLNGLEEKPALVKPNQAELAQILGHDPSSLEGVARAALGLCEQRIRQVFVTLGSRGALAAADGRVIRGEIEPIEAVSAVGSGDAFAASLSAAWVRDEPLELALRRGIACGAASALRLGPAFVDLAEVDALSESVTMNDSVI